MEGVKLKEEERGFKYPFLRICPLGPKSRTSGTTAESGTMAHEMTWMSGAPPVVPLWNWRYYRPTTGAVPLISTNEEMGILRVGRGVSGTKPVLPAVLPVELAVQPLTIWR